MSFLNSQIILKKDFELRITIKLNSTLKRNQYTLTKKSDKNFES
jgi:hypothetical protein